MVYKNDRNRIRRFLAGTGFTATRRDNHVNLETNQFSRQRGEWRGSFPRTRLKLMFFPPHNQARGVLAPICRATYRKQRDGL